MGMTPEQKARVSIDALLIEAGWKVRNVAGTNIHSATDVASQIAIVGPWCIRCGIHAACMSKIE
jgi:hypothetical protein